MIKKFIQYCMAVLLGVLLSTGAIAKIIIAIDPGHGGTDVGAIGRRTGIYEKDLTLAISKEFKALLDADPRFKTVMIRNGDDTVDLFDRPKIARKANADYFISIHVNSLDLNTSPGGESIRGVSTHVLSNMGASTAVDKWLENKNEQSPLLDKTGRILADTNESHLGQTILDLQFSHSKRAGYELANSVLEKLADVAIVNRKHPVQEALVVLKAPDITSILVETGYLTNAEDEQLLMTQKYRRKIANAIYKGLVAYVNKTTRDHPPKIVYKKEEKSVEQAEGKSEKKVKGSNNDKPNDKKNTVIETKAVSKENKKGGEAKRETNNKAVSEMKSSPSSSGTTTEKMARVVDPNATHHIVAQDETLYSIARMYKTTPEKLSQLNGIKDNKITVGQKLKVK